MDVFVLVVLVDSGPWLKERLHEQVQEGRHPDLRGHTASLERNARNRLSGKSTYTYSRSEGMPAHIQPRVLNPAGVPVCARAEDVMGKDEEEDRNISTWVYTQVSHLIIKMKATYEFNGRRVHACKHLEQDCNVSRIQGSFGQHSPKGLTGPGVGGSCAQC